MKVVIAAMLACIFGVSKNAGAQVRDNKTTDSLLRIAGKPSVDSNNYLALQQLVQLHLEKGDYNSVLNFSRKALLVAEKIGNKRYLGLANYYVGYGIGALGNYDSTKYYFEIAEKIMQQQKDTLNLVNLYNSYSILYNFQSNYSTAVQYLMKGADMLKNADNSTFRKLLSQIYANLGINLVAENQLELGIDYQKKALALFSLNEHPSATRYKAIIYTQIADAYIKSGKFAESRLYLDSAFAIYTYYKNPDLENSTLNTEATYFNLTGNPQKALDVYLKALTLNDSTRVEKTRAETLGNIAVQYLQLHDEVSASKFALQASELGTKLKLLKVVAKAYGVLKKTAAHSGDFQNAFRYAELYKQYDDSATNIETQKTVLALEGKYQLKKKEGEIASLTLSNREQELKVANRNRLLLIGGTSAAALLVLTGMRYRNIKQKQVLAQRVQQLQNEQIKFLERQQQVISLQSMINGQETERTRIAKDLHDGLGGLFSTVKMYFSTLQHEQESLKNNTLFRKSYELIDTASVEVRRIAHNMMPEVLIKLGLVSALQDLCSNISAGKLMQVKLQAYGMDKRLIISTEIMLYRIVQELLNNIIKHSQASEAIVQFNRANSQLTVTVEDNGRGFNPEAADRDNHAGLETIKSRVSYLNGTITIESQEQIGTTVMMEFLLNETA